MLLEIFTLRQRSRQQIKISTLSENQLNVGSIPTAPTKGEHFL